VEGQIGKKQTLLAGATNHDSRTHKPKILYQLLVHQFFELKPLLFITEPILFRDMTRASLFVFTSNYIIDISSFLQNFD